MDREILRLHLDEVNIRVAVQSDLPGLEWEGEFTHFRRLYQDIYQSARRGEAILWVAELAEQELIGQLFVQFVSARPELADGSTRAYVYGFRIKPFYRNQGLGSWMMRVAEQMLMDRRYSRAVLNVNRDNLPARRLYERLGYQVVAPEDGRWSYLDHHGIRQNVNEPAWRMEKVLTRTGD